MKWFKHKTDSVRDAKLRKVILRYGTDGYAIYFHCLELIAGNVSDSNITFELEHDAEVIADNLRIQGTADKSALDKVNEIMRFMISLGLFENADGTVTCLKMLKTMDSSMASGKMRGLIDKARSYNNLTLALPPVMIDPDPVMIDPDTIMINPDLSCKTRLDKTRLENSKDESTCSTGEVVKGKVVPSVTHSRDRPFVKPTLEDVKRYCKEINYSLTAEIFLDYYESKGWLVGKAPMKDWKAAVRNWRRNDKEEQKKPQSQLMTCEKCGRRYLGKTVCPICGSKMI